MDPSLTPATTILVLLALVPILTDGIISRQCLNSISTEMPTVIRLSCGRSGEIPVTINRQGTTPHKISVGLDLPSSIVTEKEIIQVAIDRDQEGLLFKLPLTATQRGRFLLSLIMIATPSRLGFWEMRQSRTLTTEIRVYPDLKAERKTMAALFLPKYAIGIHSRRQVGQGREFEKLREYQPGDSLDMIHWKATAKRHLPMSKVYQVERVQEVYVIIDSARLSGQPLHGTAGEQRLETFIKAALVMGMATQNQGDLFGLLTFSHKVDTFLRAKGGKAHFNGCRDHLYMLEAQSVTPDFRELTVFIRQRLKKRALLVIMTSLDDPILAEELTKSLELITRHHLVIVMVMEPATAQPLFANEQVTSLDDIRRKLIGHMQDQALRTIEQDLRHRGVTLIRANNATLSLQMVQQYMSVKARQIL